MDDRPVRSPGGGIAVVTTERGLPTRLRIDARELSRDAQELAREILSLCQLSAIRQQVARRRELADRGFGASVVNDLNLATAQELAAAEAKTFGDDDGPPDTWMRSP